jgi:hypothetical protein
VATPRRWLRVEGATLLAGSLIAYLDDDNQLKKEHHMSILIRFTPNSLTAEQYDDVVRRLTDAGVFPADGLDYEVCFGSGDQHRVSQVWDTQEHLDAFGAKLMPILAEVGIDPGQPETVEVHNIIKQ